MSLFRLEDRHELRLMNVSDGMGHYDSDDDDDDVIDRSRNKIFSVNSFTKQLIINL